MHAKLHKLCNKGLNFREKVKQKLVFAIQAENLFYFVAHS